MSKKRRDYHHKQRQSLKRSVDRYVEGRDLNEGLYFGEAAGGDGVSPKTLGEIGYRTNTKKSEHMPGTCNLRDCKHNDCGRCMSEAVRCEYEER